MPESAIEPDGGEHPVCFLHLVKCAGTSMRIALLMALPPESLAPQACDTSVFCDFDEFEQLGSNARPFAVVNDEMVRRLGDYRAVAGHFWLSTLLEVAPPSSVATILREPRARLLSLYSYWRVTPWVAEGLRPYDAFAHALRPVDEFLTEPRIAGIVDNYVCRALLRGDPRMPVDRFIDPGDVDAIAADAIAALSELGFVGIIELPDQAREGLAKMFGVELEDLRVNVTGEAQAIVPEAQGVFTWETPALLAQRTAADAIVYQHFLGTSGLDPRAAQQLREAAFASQLVRLGDVAGASAARLSGEPHRASVAADPEPLPASSAPEPGRDLELDRQRAAYERARDALAAVERSASWRLTAPLRRAKRSIKSAADPFR